MMQSINLIAIRCWQRIVFCWRRAQLYRDLVEELELHRSLKQHEYEQLGLLPNASAEMTAKQMGNISLAKEASRDMWTFLSLERLWQDLHYAIRMLRRAPGFTSVAVLSLALGIGGNAAMFSLVDTLLVRPLPYVEPDRLIRITGVYPRAAVPFFQERARTMVVAAASSGGDLNLTGQGEAVRIVGSSVSANFYSVLGAPVARGRTFQAGEDVPGHDGVVIISDSLWKARFGGDPEIIGRVIALNGISRVIVQT